MKTLYLPIIMLTPLFLLISCKNITNSGSNNLSISGNWNWIKSEGWPGTNTPERAGYTKQIVFGMSGIYLEYRNDSLFLKSNYKIVKKDINDDMIDESIITIDEYLSEYLVESIQNDTLLLRITNCADC